MNRGLVERMLTHAEGALKAVEAGQEPKWMASGRSLLLDGAHEIQRLRTALAKAIKEADGWCDESRGVPCPGLNQERMLAGLPLVKDD